MTTSYKIEPGQIWLVYLYFSNHPEIGKVRPVLIVGTEDECSIAFVLKITTKATFLADSIFLENWEQYGLRKPSFVRTDIVFKIKVRKRSYRKWKYRKRIRIIRIFFYFSRNNGIF